MADKRSQCPCCLCERDDLPFILGSLDENTPLAHLKRSWIGVGKSPFFTYYKCRSCGCLYNSVYPDPTTLRDLYSSMPRNMEEAVSIKDQRMNQRGYATTISGFWRRSNHSMHGLHVLEIGADCGFLLEELAIQNNVTLASADAVEPNQVVTQELTSRLISLSKEQQIFSDISDIKRKGSRFYDAIIAIHVFDHVFDIEKTLHTLTGMLHRDGMIFFVVHNSNSTIAGILGKKWPPYCAQHPQLFCPDSVSSLSRRLGLKVTETGRTVNHFSLDMITGFFDASSTFTKGINVAFPLGNRYYILEKAG